MCDYTYGPIQSRRLGLSLGINLLPNYKLCTFNCTFCEIGSTDGEHLVPPSFRIKLPPTDKFRKELVSTLSLVPHLKSITFGYNGVSKISQAIFIQIKLYKSSGYLRSRDLISI